MSKEVIYFSKEGLSARDALINQGNLWGNSFFTTTLVRNGKVIFWEQHQNRIRENLLELWEIEETKDILDHLNLSLSKVIDEFKEINFAYTRVTFYKELNGQVQFWIWCLEKSVPKDTLNLKSFCWSPNENFSEIIKRPDYQFTFSLREQMKELGFNDLLMLNDEGEILELPTSNIFFVKGKQYFIPQADFGILKGVMQDRIMIMLKARGIDIIMRPINIDELSSFDNCFATSSFSGIRHIGAIDDIEYSINEDIDNLLKDFYGEIW